MTFKHRKVSDERLYELANRGLSIMEIYEEINAVLTQSQIQNTVGHGRRNGLVKPFERAGRYFRKGVRHER